MTMLLPRVIPCLLLQGRGLVKTVKFADPVYLGDPINIVKIFNDKEVDELVLLDIAATRNRRGPNFELLAEIASEAFVPLAYGGGITKVEEIQRILNLGYEKVVLNSSAFEIPDLVRRAADQVGSQSIVVSIDVRRSLLGASKVLTHCGEKPVGGDPVEWAQRFAGLGAGEILITAVDRDGTLKGYDLELVRKVSQAVGVPVIASGGAATVADFGRAVKQAGASAVAAGSLFVFVGPNRAVLITFPKRTELKSVFS